MIAALAKSKPGFGISQQTPRQIIKSMCQSEVLRAHNIDSYVLENRKNWNSDYAHRVSALEQHPLECYSPAESFADNQRGYHATAKQATINRYFGRHGFWSLIVLEFPDQKCTDFSIVADIGGQSAFHKEAARSNIIRVYGEDVYKEWRRRVLDTYEESITWLMNDITEKCPGLKAWSVTSCESAERLMARTPNVYLHRKVAFLIVPEK